MNYCLKECFCATCGKLFIPAVEHMYKASINGTTKMYCSWTCYNHREEKARGRHGKKVVQSRPDGVDIRMFDSANKASTFIGGKVDTLRKACKEGKVYRGYLWRYAEN